jgi:hypothetical protein
MQATFTAPVQPGPRQLKAFGYAAGQYSATCLGCGKQYNGMDKRATSCKDCARRRYNRMMAEIRIDEPAAEAVG